MARKGGNPNIAEAGKNTRFNGYTAVKAGEKSGETRRALASLNADLREQCTPEVLAEINKRLLQMAKHGNLKAYELLRDGLGEKPTEKVAVGATAEAKSELKELLEQRHASR